MRAMFMVAVFVAVGLAGCANGDAKGPEDVSFEDLDAEATATTGVILGVVVDDTLTPLAGATIKVMNTPFEATSDELGRFAFSDMQPGNHFLQVTRERYDTVQQSVVVEAGVEKPPVVRVMLQLIPGSEPYFVPLAWEGHIGCAYRRWNPPSGGYGTTCPAASTIWPEHDNLEDYTLDKVPSYVQSSIVWKNTQMFGGEISYNLRRTDTNTDTVDHDGTSPITLDMPPEKIARDPENENRGGFDENTPLRVIVFTAHLQETEPPTGGWGFGLQIDQKFNTYTHILYNFQPAEGWNFLTDGDPVLPDV